MMKGNMKKAFDKLTAMGAPVFERSDEPGRFLLSAESGCDKFLIDYNWMGGYFGVDEEISDVVHGFGLDLEWENPGCLVCFVD